MSLSKVFKNRAGSEPFIMDNLGRETGAETNEKGEDVGSNALAIEREAYEKGFASGEKAGFEFGRQKAEVLFQGLSGILAELSSFREGLYRKCEKEMVELCLGIAKKVIRHETEERREVVVDCVRSALKVVVASGGVLVKINPKDLEVIHQHKADLEKYTDGLKDMSVEADESILRGGCIIETNYGEVDATITGVIAEIEERLRNAG